MSEPAATVDDWTRVDAGTFHDFHQTWIPQLKLALNGGLLPPGYYGHVERSFGAVSAAENEADLLALEDGTTVYGGDQGGGTAVLEAPPQVSEVTDLAEVSESEYYAARASRLAIRREIDHRVVALLELASPGNKDRPASVDRFVSKLTEAMEDGVHVVLIDLLPPGRPDPAGLHGAMLEALGRGYEPPADKPLCAVGYQVGPRWRAYAEPLAVGDPLPTVPLFLTPERYVPLPLGSSYKIARGGIGRFWEEVLDGTRDAPGRS
ncbi:DUF4058 family protein [Alienimonas chondri]|uniref:DUF4058 family protein n=1 Tax=Alienimonas chondri TaxID=2681879 RepID=A0ABX1VDW0_9PLAN|nr:DUF4058 family protein [Alienimonas chondri]NNJ25478.1 hypothetical protein [Alienimonas chondri]